MNTREQIFLYLVLIIVLFMVWGKIDWVVYQRPDIEPASYNFGYIQVPSYWFWMWLIHVPLTSLLVMLAFWIGAPDTDQNNLTALGLFLTILLFWMGGLEDVFYFVLNGQPFPAGEWIWFKGTTVYWAIFGTWNTPLHFLWLGFFCFLVFLTWAVIDYYEG